MDERINFFVGLDAHKDTIAVAACEAGREPARFAGTLGPDVRALLKVLGKAGDPAAVSVVYEAGPTGYGLYRERRSCHAQANSSRSGCPTRLMRPCVTYGVRVRMRWACG
jgi:hypothetical protein